MHPCYQRFKWDALQYWKDAIDTFVARDWPSRDQLRARILNNRLFLNSLVYKSSLTKSDEQILQNFGLEKYGITTYVFNDDVTKPPTARRENDRASAQPVKPNIPANAGVPEVPRELKCDLCPERFHKMKMILTPSDLEIHNKLWHDEKYQDAVF